MLINDEDRKQILPLLARSTYAPSAEVKPHAAAQLQLNPGLLVKAADQSQPPRSPASRQDHRGDVQA
jgi:hypothetical protein